MASWLQNQRMEVFNSVGATNYSPPSAARVASCDSCPSLSIIKNSIYDACFCQRCQQGSSPKFIYNRLKETDKILRPEWCPLSNKTEKAITPHTKWEDIKAYKVYHIPSAPGVQRKDIWVSFVSKNVVGYKEIKNGTIAGDNTIHCFYPNDKEMQYIVEKRKV